jgi:uncharacterized protein YbjT (DUF2867 family)
MIVVTGATGNVGRELVQVLRDLGEAVTAVTRRPEAAVGHGNAVIADPSHPGTMLPALKDATALYLNPATLGDACTELLALAAAHGVQRVVLQSALSVEYKLGAPQFAEQFKRIEECVQASGLPWVILRCASFNINNLRVWGPQIHSSDVVRGAYGEAATSSIHERDIAEVAVHALTKNTPSAIYTITGPQTLTEREKLSLIGKSLRRNLVWEETPPEAIRQAMRVRGLPESAAERMLAFLADCARRPEPITDTVYQLLGRPALSFAQWVSDHAESFRGDVA